MTETIRYHSSPSSLLASITVGTTMVMPDRSRYRVVALRFRRMTAEDADPETGWTFDADAWITLADAEPVE